MQDVDDTELTALLVAVGRDEASLSSWRRDCLDPLLARYGGHVVAVGRSRLLAEFDGVTDAVNCALAAQRRAGVAPGIGINLGELRVDDNSVGGEDLNFALSLAERAEPGGICVSGISRNQVTTDISAEAVTAEGARPRYLIASTIAASVLLAYFLIWYGLIAWKTIAYELYGSYPCWPAFLCG